MLLKNLPPKPTKRVPPLPPIKLNQESEKHIDPELGQLAGLSKRFHSKKNLNRQNSAKSLNTHRVYRPTSASSLKSRGSSRQSTVSSSGNIPKQGVLKNPPKITSFNWGIFQIKNGLYLSGMRTQKRREFASLTKIMNFTTILSILNEYDLAPSSIKVVVNETASKLIGTTAEIKKGYKLSLEDLFYGMMLPSGNDAAYQIAQIGGEILKLCREEKRKKELVYSCQFLSKEIESQGRTNVIRYLAEMNRISKYLGLSKSKWSNPHGLSNRENVSTVHDLFLLCRYAMKKNEFRKVVNTKEYSCVVEYEAEEEKENMEQNIESQKTTKRVEWKNTNKMLWKGWNGIKTGITPNAGPCLAATVDKTIGGKEYEFLVILGACQSMDQRWDEVDELVNWAVGLKKEWEDLIDC